MKIKLEAREFKTRESAHKYLKEILDLPEYYGENLDALYDCLGEVYKETLFIIPEKIADKEHLGEYGETMIRVFKDAAEENPNIKVKIKKSKIK